MNLIQERANLKVTNSTKFNSFDLNLEFILKILCSDNLYKTFMPYSVYFVFVIDLIQIRA